MCAFEWKTWECDQTAAWNVYSNGMAHLRGGATCSGKHRVPITSEVQAYAKRLEASGMQPRKIWSTLRRAPDIPQPPLGIPSHQQIADCVKRLCKKNISRNTRHAVKELAREHPYYDGIGPGKAFFFGSVDEEDGFPRVGKGSTADPFAMYVTTLGLLAKVHQFRRDEHFRLFHTDATFKLSDLGYPVLTCGFMDRKRIYHLAAIMVVSARTHTEYEMAFRIVADVYSRIYREELRVDAVMGDADDAQFNALRCLPTFSESKYLMCFFHVLYNVHNRTRHLESAAAVAVFTGIMDMHYTSSYTEYCSVRDRVISKWRQQSTFRSFTDYFEKEWIQRRFWRWQVYHTPSSYATTNNPCEVFNASVKRHVQRKASEICALLRSMVTLVEDVGCDVPNPSSSIAPPNVEIKKTSKWMLQTRVIIVATTSVEAEVRVLHILEVHIDVDVLETMRRLASSDISTDGEESSVTAFVLRKPEKAKAARLYRDSVKWSTRRAHRVGMPRDGWLVNVDENRCDCSAHLKFGVCAHVVATRSVLGLQDGFGLGDKLMCRRARKKQRTQRTNLAQSHRYCVKHRHLALRPSQHLAIREMF
jgi:hypothetical protein